MTASTELCIDVCARTRVYTYMYVISTFCKNDAQDTPHGWRGAKIYDTGIDWFEE